MTVQKAQGIVESVSVRALDAPDRFDNTHKHGLKVNGEWFDFGGSKMDAFKIKDDEGNWKALGKGSEVLIKFEQNGNFRNSKKTWLTVLNLVEGGKEAPAAPAARPATTPAKSAPPGAVARSGGSGGTDWARKDAGAAASASIDKAIRYLGIVGFPESNLPHGDYNRNMETILNIARTMNGLTATLLEEILAGKVEALPESGVKAQAPAPATPAVAKAVAKKAAAKPAPAPKQESWEEEEDEIPF